MCAEGKVPQGLPNLQPEMGLEPLPLLIDQRHQANGRAQQTSGQLRDAIELRLLGRVQNPIPAQRRQASPLAGVGRLR